MNVVQMVEHCIRFEEIMAAKTPAKRVLLGYLFGKIALKSMIGNLLMAYPHPTCLHSINTPTIT